MSVTIEGNTYTCDSCPNLTVGGWAPCSAPWYQFLDFCSGSLCGVQFFADPREQCFGTGNGSSILLPSSTSGADTGTTSSDIVPTAGTTTAATTGTVTATATATATGTTIAITSSVSTGSSTGAISSSTITTSRITTGTTSAASQTPGSSASSEPSTSAAVPSAPGSGAAPVRKVGLGGIFMCILVAGMVLL